MIKFLFDQIIIYLVWIEKLHKCVQILTAHEWNTASMCGLIHMPEYINIHAAEELSMFTFLTPYQLRVVHVRYVHLWQAEYSLHGTWARSTFNTLFFITILQVEMARI